MRSGVNSRSEGVLRTVRTCGAWRASASSRAALLTMERRSSSFACRSKGVEHAASVIVASIAAGRARARYACGDLRMSERAYGGGRVGSKQDRPEL